MLLFAIVQVVFAVAAVYCRRQGRDELRSRHPGGPVPPGHRLLGPGGRHVRRAVADHPHHQRRAAGADARGDGVHDGHRRADHDRRRRDHGAAPGRRPVDRAPGRHAAGGRRARDASSARWCRRSVGCRTTSTPSTASCGSRSPASGWCGPSPASRRRPSASRSANADLTATALRGGRLMSSMFPTVNLLINLSSVAVLWIGADRVGTGDLEVGSLIAYLSYLIQILMSVVMATFTMSMVPRAAVSADRIQEVLDTESSVAPPADPVRDVRRHGALEVRDVGFHYPGAERPVLSDITFATAAGHTTAIVGSTGAGKTSLVNLLARLFDPTAGSVLRRRRRPARPGPRPAWRRIGLVPQKPYLFSGTVASNLQFGKPDATEAEMWEALEVAQAADFVRAMPGGLEARDRAGRHQRVGRAAPAALDRPGARAQARALRVRRLVLGARPRHRRPPAGRPRAVHPRRGGRDRRPARVDHRHRRRDPRARGRRAGRPRHPRGAARDLPDLRRDRAVPDRRAERAASPARSRRRPSTAALRARTRGLA